MKRGKTFGKSDCSCFDAQPPQMHCQDYPPPWPLQPTVKKLYLLLPLRTPTSLTFLNMLLPSRGINLIFQLFITVAILRVLSPSSITIFKKFLRNFLRGFKACISFTDSYLPLPGCKHLLSSYYILRFYFQSHICVSANHMQIKIYHYIR